tara:strand:+ start:841 stop:1431 length:591 start_codon:yes stop_codon:yes gene_type:complete
MSCVENPPNLRKKRVFVGLKISLYEEIQPAIVDLRQAFANTQGGLRPATRENLHLTLKFLGSVEGSDLPKIDSIISEAASRHPGMHLNFAGIGLFKNSIWVGVKENLFLRTLALDLNHVFVSVGVFPERKPYVPHVTVARFARNAKFTLAPLMEKYVKHEWGFLEVSEIFLYKSETLSEGARYSILNSYKLKSQNQ